MSKKKLFVVDIEQDFQNQVKSVCPPDQVEVQSFSSSMEIFSIITKEKPPLIFLDLDVPDINDFVMYDLLKKTNSKSIKVLLTYSDQSEPQLQQYKKLKFQAQGYHKKPLSNQNLREILELYLDLKQEKPEDEDDDFSDLNIDRLVRGELSDARPGAKAKEKPLILEDTQDEFDENKSGRMDHELRNQVISLERQNEFLRSENKELSKTIEDFKTEIVVKNDKIEELRSKLNEKTAELHETTADKKVSLGQLEQKLTQLQNEYDNIQKESEEQKQSLLQKIETLKNYSEKLEIKNTDILEKLKHTSKENADIQLQLKELTNQLTDKERELVAKNHEFEKKLQAKSEELLQEAEERLRAEFRKKEDRFQHHSQQINEEKKQLQDTFNEELEKLKQSNIQTREEYDELKKREESLNRTISTLAEEKVTLAEKVAGLEEDRAIRIKQANEKEKEHRTTFETLNEELHEAQADLNFYRNRVKELGEILQKALALAQPGNRE